ncbi:hypothetical protein [Tropicibacter naphthalenivorans]|uniref:Short chain dehydrogenase n=1 Tax=Tropicibacter naphthalenivorans TaxID=441103 RepID=A0A0N7LZB7_9RHOB|nr:hypothetical protein [Tropicibacter naphthalenivorans]CUH77217.1 hypothetical protein TRN7648_01354 [Tropicibacter naphthalenivorans]SMC59850.1 hypothetical protein SAMN04488093_102264 [Tropicibacter naphthalenivorans]
MFGVSRFYGKTAVIAGAEHPLGASVCERLAQFGAAVVAMGRDQDALLAVARKAPGQIDTLALPKVGHTLEVLKSSWLATPLHVYIDLLPLSERSAFDQSAGLAAALRMGLRIGKGRAVIALPYDKRPDALPAEVQARFAGYSAMVEQFAKDAQPARVMGLGLPADPFPWDTISAVSAGDSVLALCHDVSRGLKTGSFLDWVPEPH